MPAVHLTAPELRAVLHALSPRTRECPIVASARRQLQLALDRATRSRA
jgi:hypothetical protein